ncbi:uncharacterized protein LOC143377299 [Andrena cerasifolii]|uniref:uncharacterized protein LOC143377299 n=1 Tax=Andrena cerasifolii TaxID=2819439 RepID=UPI0040376479
MFRSKAAAALMRLKEMDRKYNIKRNEVKRGQSNVSTESSLDGSSKDHRPASRASSHGKPEVDQGLKVAEADDQTKSKVSPKPKIQVRIPSFLTKDDPPSTDDEPRFRSSEGSPRMHSKASIAEDNADDLEEEGTMSKESSRSSLNPDPSIKELSSSFKARVKLETPDSRDLLRSSEGSSVATMLSEASGGSEVVSELARSAEMLKLDVHGETTAESSAHGLDSEQKTIEEVVDTPADKSQSRGSSMEVQRVQYESDTFEEASSSIGSFSSAEERLKKASEGKVAQDTIRSGVKQIMITPHKQAEAVVPKSEPDERDKEIIELVAPKVVKSTSECDLGLDEELSRYVRSTEDVDEALPISLLKPSKQTALGKKQPRRSKRHRMSSNENTEEMPEKEEFPAASDQERLTKWKGNKGEESSPMIMRSLEQEKEMSEGKGSEESKAECMEVEKGAQKNELDKVEPESISSETLLGDVPRKSDATCTLRKLNRDAIDAIARRHRIHTPREASNKCRQCRACGTVVKLPSTECEARGKPEADESRSASLENFKEPTQDQRTRKRNKGKRVCKSSKARRTSHRGKVEEKQSRFECRQTHRLRKHAAALRLQQEREDIHNYLLELERTRLEFGPGDSILYSKVTPFRPLEFPKIATFMKPGLGEADLKPTDEVAGLQERISMIRQWLKDQYVLYRDYSSLAQTTNAKYIPASLEDAKRTIRQLQKATIKTR